jgi:hypothetical protein
VLSLCAQACEDSDYQDMVPAKILYRCYHASLYEFLKSAQHTCFDAPAESAEHIQFDLARNQNTNQLFFAPACVSYRQLEDYQGLLVPYLGCKMDLQ